MATENINIIIREDGSREVVRNINAIGAASSKSSSAVDLLKRSLGALAGSLALTEIARYADTWTRATGKINIFTKDAEETAAVMERIYGIAQDTRQPIDGVASSFHQLSIAGSALGASQEQLLTFTEAIGKALAIQGTDANTARGGIIQLGQAMNEGIVRAQEYNSMINAMPMVLKTVANNLEGVDGSLAKLRARMLEGKLYSKDFFEALLKGAGDLDALFDRSGKTIGQSFTIIENALTKYIGEIDAATGASAKFYDAAVFVAENIDTIVKALVSIASPFILQGIISVTGALKGLALAAAANPFVAIAAAITAAITALYLFKDDIIILQDESVTLGDYMSAAWDISTEAAGDFFDYVTDELPAMADEFAKELGIVGGLFGAIGDDAVTVVNKIVGLFNGLGKSIGIVFAGIGPALKDSFISMFNEIIEMTNNLNNKLIGMANSIRSKLGLELLDEVTIAPMVNNAEGQAAMFGDAIKTAFSESMNVDYIQGMLEKGGSMVDKLSERARQAARERQAEEARRKAAQGAVDLGVDPGSGESYAGSGGGGGALTKMQEREKERMLRSLRSETEQIEAEYQKRNQLILMYTEAGSAQRAELQKRSDQEYADENRKLQEQMTGAFATETQKLEQVYAQRTEMILRNTEEGSAAQQAMLDRLKEQRAIDEAEIRQQEQAKVDALYNGLLTEEEQIMQSYERRKQMILDATNITEAQRADLIKRTEQQLIKEQQELETQRMTMLLSGAASTFDALAGIAEAAGGKQSRAYKVLFGASKAFALANAVVQMQSAIANAASSGPFPANLGFMATMAAQMASVISAIQGVSMVGQAHDGIDNVPESGTWNLQKGERVIDRRTNGDLKDFMKAGGGSGGEGVVVQMPVNIINNAGNDVAVRAQQTTDENGDSSLEVIIDKVESAMAAKVGSGRGELHGSIAQAFNLNSAPKAG